MRNRQILAEKDITGQGRLFDPLVSWTPWDVALPYRSSIVSSVQPACRSAWGTMRAPSPRSRKKRTPDCSASPATAHAARRMASTSRTVRS